MVGLKMINVKLMYESGWRGEVFGRWMGLLFFY